MVVWEITRPFRRLYNWEVASYATGRVCEMAIVSKSTGFQVILPVKSDVRASAQAVHILEKLLPFEYTGDEVPTSLTPKYQAWWDVEGREVFIVDIYSCDQKGRQGVYFRHESLWYKCLRDEDLLKCFDDVHTHWNSPPLSVDDDSSG